MKRTSMFAVVLLLAAVLTATSQPQLAPPDTTLADSLVMRMMEGIGDAFSGQPFTVFADTQWYWSDVRTLPEALSALPGTYSFEGGEEGKPAQLWYLGSSGAGTQMSLDGTPVGSPLFPSSAITTFPLEFIESIEQLRGPAALLLGTRWNLRTHQYASPEPHTAVRFVQSPFETIFTDGFYAQNIARSTSLTFGFQRRTSDGRFKNAALDSWSLRGRIRANVTSWLNLMGTWQHEKTSNGMNGGIDRRVSTVMFDEVSAVVVEPEAYELRTASTWSLHALADVFRDSLSLTRLTVTRTDEDREFNRRAASLYRPAVREVAITDGTRFRLEQSLALSYVTLRGMAQHAIAASMDSTVLRAAERSTTAVGVSAEGRFSEFVVPSVGYRFDSATEGSRSSLAASIDLNILTELAISAAVEQRSLFPAFRAAASRDSMVIFPTTVPIGSEQLATLSATWRIADESYIALEGFARTQRNTLFFRMDTSTVGTPVIRAIYENADISGIQASGRAALGPFYISGWITLMQTEAAGSVKNAHPPVWARWEAGWKNRLFGDELGLQVSLRGSFYDRYDGFAPDPRTGILVVQSSVPIGRMTRLDGFAVMDIGNAFVSLAWENMLSTNYYKMATYPMYYRRFSLGVRWMFLD